MNIQFNLLPTVVFAVVCACWLVLGGAFFLLKRGDGSADRKRAPASLIGFALQLVGIAVIWLVHRPPFTPISSTPKVLELWLAIIACALSISSAWMMLAAIRVLGRQWSLTARVIENHELITAGPYRLVRHPIYTALLAMIIASGLAQGYWWDLLLAVAVYLIGTLIRIRSEEKLLRETFGAEYEAFAHRVPALIPKLY
ncbi:MAG: isoprenylcysteine carboxylmethyltransferase family protein [Acidobacteria bacterium]|nr:isoprenylcysteine carboxylmethyltransferase family protein [Acidobacteriota bacterium]